MGLKNSKDLLNPISPRNHMIKRTGKLNSWFSRHVFLIVKLKPQRQHKSSYTRPHVLIFTSLPEVALK